MTKGSRTWTVSVAPVHLGGRLIGRMITDGEMVRSQVWDASGPPLWYRGKGHWRDGATIAEIDWAPPAKPELLGELGIPESREGDPA